MTFGKGDRVRHVRDTARMGKVIGFEKNRLIVKWDPGFSKDSRKVQHVRPAVLTAMPVRTGPGPGRRRVLSDQQVAAAQKCVSRGQTVAAVAEQIGVGTSTLYRYLQRAA